jgi:hypothetical protein
MQYKFVPLLGLATWLGASPRPTTRKFSAANIWNGNTDGIARPGWRSATLINK